MTVTPGRRLILLVTLLLPPLAVPAADALGEPRGWRSADTRQANAAARRIEGLSRRVVDEAKVTGLAVAMVHEGEVILETGFGITEVGRRESVDADTVFRIASLSKTFAGALAAQLVAEGALRWDSRIADQLPEFKLRDIHAAQQLTVLDILSHRVGLPYHTLDRDLEADQPYPLLVAKLGDAPTACAPGDCYGYQNIAFSLVGDMVFATTGEFYSFQVEKRLFAPLGMDTATYGREGLEGSGNWARPHIRVQNRLQPVTAKETYYRVAPAAGVNASPRDLGQWLLAQMGGFPDALPRELLDELHAPIVETPGEIRGTGWRRQRLNAAAYGLGWRIMDYAGERLVFHAGAVQGYRAMLGFLPDHGFGFAVVWNSEAGQPAGLLPVALDRFLGLPEVDWLELNRLNVRLPPSAQATASGSD